MIHEWLFQIDQGNLVGTVFFDMKKAFDLVDHEILLDKLNIYNFHENYIKWLKSYLSERIQQVEYNNIKSSSRIIKYGVPQGSVHALVLFLLHINDLPLYTKLSNTDMYANDATFHEASNDPKVIQQQLQEDI